MRHHNANRKFGRTRNQRNALLKHLAESLVRYEKIETTEAKAKELKSFIEKLVTRARKGDVAAHRILVARLGSKTAAKKLIDEIAPKYEKREGGYTRVIKLPARKGDAAKMAVIEFV
ncbi:50S ribosomal protein L17 [bacterium]|nr:50S ribosomal protein L17 [bacterium]|tara:strand:+ start:11423 stop:11773 length:351 start_codon:yes stop_codon:yes gene_type:complete